MGASSDAPIHDQDVTRADTGIDAATRCGAYASPLHLPQGICENSVSDRPLRWLSATQLLAKGVARTTVGN